MTVASFPVFGSQLPECDTLPYSQNNKETCTSSYIDVTVLDRNETVQNQSEQNQSAQNQTVQNQTVQNQSAQNQTVQNQTVQNQSAQNQTHQNQSDQNQTVQNQTVQNQSEQNQTVQIQSDQNQTVQNQSDQNQTVQIQSDQNQTVQNQSEQNQTSSANKQLWLLVGIPVAGTAVLILFVLSIVCVCLHVRHKKNSALSSNIRNRVESQGQHTTNQYPVDESTEMVSITVANEGSNNNHCAALTPPVKKKSDRYLVMPKSIENIVTVLEGEDKERIVSIHELEELAEDLGDLLVDFNQVIIHEVLGQGAFGLVQRGSLAKDGQLIPVAIKSLKDTWNMTDVLEFVRESCMMASFHHPNILGVSGVCLDMSNGRSPLILVPFMVNGDLKTFLQKSRIGTKEDEDKTDISGIQLLSFCIQIAQGMEYLSNLLIVHRDLAARNCMLDERMVVKVGDFGLSRDIYSHNYYRMGSKGRVPVKWMAPESLTDNIYTVYTDVWSFGVTMWEIYSHGKVPYPGIPNYEVLEYIENGHRLSKPKLCSTEVFAFALKCWEWNANDRPSFHELNEELSCIAGDQAGYIRPLDWRGSGGSDESPA
ncbi:tyrosine-protein kinase RYK-like isoform X2 [Corticium candelabrum]|nr:tyrosine-protein kinase RYK-like isoform X2 [Corticium candelabrum]XP_062519627.1 tyrosine-protein kinase RYK-like isoform X2 [Corticium candelabrum]